jgi:regulator of extracellular matrix RemA (YlzA/DUF370 family)
MPCASMRIQKEYIGGKGWRWCIITNADNIIIKMVHTKKQAKRFIEKQIAEYGEMI